MTISKCCDSCLYFEPDSDLPRAVACTGSCAVSRATVVDSEAGMCDHYIEAIGGEA